ncbi:MAG: hypothetical protein ACLGI6_06820 [Gammaproteobacteria bacterium]
MKLAVHLVLGAVFALGAPAFAATPAPAAAANDPHLKAEHVKAVQDLLAAMQAEKLMRSTASASRYNSEAQRKAVFDKLDKVPAAVIHQRLAAPVAKLVSAETAAEMTRFYGSSFGQKVLKEKYNSGPRVMLGQQGPVPTAAEKKELKRPEYLKASKALADAEPGIEHECFVLLQAIIKGK